MPNKNIIYIIILLVAITLLSQETSRRSAKKFTYDNKTQVFQYIGDARLEDTSAVITSHTMTFYRETELATFSGNVKLASRTNDSTITAGYASYNGKTRYAYIRNRPILRSPTNNLIIRSRFMERDFNTPIAKARENVHLTHIDKENNRKTDGYARELVYNSDTEISVMQGNPVLYQENDKLEGEILEYDARKSVANVMGRGKIYILQTNNYVNSSSTNRNRENISNYNIITADRLFLDNRGGSNQNTRMLYGYGNINAFFYEENMILKGGYIEYNIDEEHLYLYQSPTVRIPDKGIIAFGEWLEYKKEEGFKDIIFHNDVIMIDYDTKLSLEGEVLHLDPDTKVATVSGSPKAYVENRTIKITSDTMQIFNDDEKIRANGNVIITSKDMNATSTWATYLEKSRYMRLWGQNPTLKQGDSIIRGREIRYYIDTEVVKAFGISGEIPQ